MNLKKSYFNFVLFIPVLFAFALNLTGYFTPRSINPGTIRGFIMIVFLFFFFLKYYPVSYTNRVVLFFILYIGFLSLFSSNLLVSLYGYMKFFIATMMFPLGYYFINSHEKLQKLSKYYLLALFVFMLNILISNVFDLGTSDYLEESFFFGAGRVTITKSTIILIFASLIYAFSKNHKYRRLIFVFLIISSFVTIVGIKRSVLLSAIAGVFIFGFTSKSKLLFFRIVIIVGIITSVVFIVFPGSFNLLINRFEAREERLTLTEETMETEARYNEINLVTQAWKNGSIKHKIFGSEMFNDSFFFKTTRMLHTDYMALLAGSGVFGLFLWFYIFYLIILEKERYWKYFKNDNRFSLYHPVFYSIIAAQLLMSISGTIQGIDLRSFILLFLGGIVGTLKGEYFSLKAANNNSQSPKKHSIKPISNFHG